MLAPPALAMAGERSIVQWASMQDAQANFEIAYAGACAKTCLTDDLS